MDTKQRTHPLDRLIPDDSLTFLEAMVPFVDYRFKKPLVLFIKFRELNAIMKCFDNRSYITECGFDCHPNSTEDMISDMCNFLPGNFAASIRQMKQMMSMMEMMNTSEMMNSFNFDPENDTWSSTAADNNSSREQPSDGVHENKSERETKITEPGSNESLFDSVMSILENESKE